MYGQRVWRQVGTVERHVVVNVYCVDICPERNEPLNQRIQPARAGHVQRRLEVLSPHPPSLLREHLTPVVTRL